jgi:branched-chain amino acid transport system substrate-binding protein
LQCLASSSTRRRAKSNGIKNIVFTTHLFLGVDTPGMKEFSEAYKQKVGSPPPNAFAPLGFDSVNLLATAIERAGSIQPDAVRSALANTRDFEGLVGKIAYSPGKRVPESSRSMMVSKRLFGRGYRSVNA